MVLRCSTKKLTLDLYFDGKLAIVFRDFLYFSFSSITRVSQRRFSVIFTNFLAHVKTQNFRRPSFSRKNWHLVPRFSSFHIVFTGKLTKSWNSSFDKAYASCSLFSMIPREIRISSNSTRCSRRFHGKLGFRFHQ